MIIARRFSWFALFPPLLLLALGACNEPPKMQHKPPHFDQAACPFKLPLDVVEGKQVRCGYLTVLEDRASSSGKTIRLAVAIFKAPRTPAAPDPVIYLYGGPGGALLSGLGPALSGSFRAALAPDRDLILLDQRGTGYSQPSLTCPEVTKLDEQYADQQISRSEQVTLQVQAMRQCHDRLVKQGINLNAYTTIADATDVHDLIQALGYKQVNLYGVSYGTRLALTVMRLFPASIRSVVLDSTVPP
jgi:pimeloyl-ACP methyl ester carboxylesterase